MSRFRRVRRAAAEKLWRWCRRKPRWPGRWQALGLVFLIGFVGVVAQWRRAEQSAAELRRHSYAGDMNLAQTALKASNLRQAKDLLEPHRPRPKESDLRNWEWRYLWQHCQSDALFALAQDHHLVFSLSFSSNGKWLAAGGLLGEVTIWDTAGRRIVKTLQERGQSARVAFFSTATG